jgi:hypothetical protein
MSILDELHIEFIRANPSPKQRARALRAYFELRDTRAALLAEIETLASRETLAAKALVAHHGKAPVTWKGQVYDPSYSPKSGKVYYLPRRGGLDAGFEVD